MQDTTINVVGWDAMSAICLSGVFILKAKISRTTFCGRDDVT